MSEDPMKAAQAAARAPAPKRFYTSVAVEKRKAGYVVLLDGRHVRTPARRLLALPNGALAGAVAEEWRSQGDTIDAQAMPILRLVNSAIDGVSDAAAQVRRDIVGFAGADLVCYRADRPDGLVGAQREHWDPLVEWARQALGVRLALAEGVMHVAQPEDVAVKVEEEAARHGPFALAAIHVMTTLTGSCVIALAVARGDLTTEEAWAAAHVDEDWQIAQWGADAEATARREARWRDMEAAARVAALLRQ